MVVKQFVKKKNEKELPFTDPLDSVNPDTIEELSDIDKIEKDSEYSEHVEKTEDVAELDDTDEPENQTKTEEIDETFEGIEDSIDDKVESKEKDDPKKKKRILILKNSGKQVHICRYDKSNRSSCLLGSIIMSNLLKKDPEKS